jgi:hypothetical protein
MNRLTIPPPDPSLDRVGTRASSADWDTLVDEPTAVYTDDGQLFAVLGLLAGDFSHLAARLLDVPRHDDIRTGAMMTRSRTFGYSPRNAVRRKEACHGFALNREHPHVFGDLSRLAVEAEQLYAEHVPAVHAAHVARMAEVHPAWRLCGTVFTSGIVNYDSPLQLHRDAGNFPDTWNVQLVFRRDVDGGHFVVPGARLAFATFDHSYLLLDAQATVHGVSPIVKRKRSGYRTSVVYYSLRQLCQCGSPDAERERAKRKRTEREQRRAGLIA